MGLGTHPDGTGDGPVFGWKQGAVVFAMAAGVAVVGVLVALGLRAWTAYDVRSSREALDEAMAPGMPAWTALEQEHGFSGAAPAVRDVGGSPGPDAEGRGHWLEVVTHQRRPELLEQGVILTLDKEGRVRLAEAHRTLPDRLRAEAAEDVGWVVFIRLARVEGAYYFEDTPVAIERLEARLVSLDSEMLAHAAAEALPPAFVPREPPLPTAFRVPPELTVRLTRRMVDAVGAPAREPEASLGPRHPER